MTAPRLTPAQQRAIDWIPKDGAWRIKPGRLSAALSSLWLNFPGCVERNWGKHGPRGGWESAWRLTPAGIKQFHGDGE